MNRPPRDWRPWRRRQVPPGLAGLLGPDAVEAGPRTLRAGEWVCRTFAVTGYPREVAPGWLEPLLTHPGRIDVAVHVGPIPAAVAAERLRRQLARLESTRRMDDDAGRLTDPSVEAAADDAAELAARLARGEHRLFRVGLYVTVWAPDETTVDAEAGKVRALLASLLLDGHPATYRSLQGWVTTLPLGVDALGMRRTFDTPSLAAGFPFSCGELPYTGGVLYGRNARSRGLVFWDRFNAHNYNSVILGSSGSGKSFLAKLELLRSLYAGVEAFVVDPEAEYRRLADAVGGTVLRLGAAGVRLNPFDLGGESDALVRRGLFLHTLATVLLARPLDPPTKAALDRAVISVYAAAGISADARTHRRPAPTLAGLADVLAADSDPAAQTLAGHLAPFTAGTHRGLFDGATTTAPQGHLVVFSLQALPDELRPAGMLLVLDAIWRQVSDPARRRRRLVLVDEAWTLMASDAGARFLFRLAKASRKHWAGLTTISQDAADLLASDLGKAVVANAATQILLRQAPQAIPALAEAFGLSEGEQAFLLAADRGEALLAAGLDRVALGTVASPEEHALITTDPAELAASKDAEPGG